MFIYILECLSWWRISVEWVILPPSQGVWIHFLCYFLCISIQSTYNWILLITFLIVSNLGNFISTKRVTCLLSSPSTWTYLSSCLATRTISMAWFWLKPCKVFTNNEMSRFEVIYQSLHLCLICLTLIWNFIKVWTLALFLKPTIFKANEIGSLVFSSCCLPLTTIVIITFFWQVWWVMCCW